MKRLLLVSCVFSLVFGCVASAASIQQVQTTGGTGAEACGAGQVAIVGCIKFGDKLFQDFSLTGPSGANASNVFVDNVPTGDVNYVVMQIGGANFAASAVDGMNNDWTFKYSVTTLGNLITSIDLSFVPSASGNSGSASIGETAFSNGFGSGVVAQSSVGCINGACDFEDPPVEPIQGDSLVFPTPLQKVWIVKDIHLIANAGGSIGATTIYQSYHQVPEPAQSAVLLAGLLAIGLYFKSRKRVQA